MRPSVFTLKFSPMIEDDCGSALKVFANFVGLSVSGICEMTSSWLVIHFVKLNTPSLRMFLIFGGLQKCAVSARKLLSSALGFSPEKL